jgi:hypothetical protein
MAHYLMGLNTIVATDRRYYSVLEQSPFLTATIWGIIQTRRSFVIEIYDRDLIPLWISGINATGYLHCNPLL